MEFTEISIASMERMRPFTEVWQLEITDMSLPNMFIWRRSHNIKFFIDDEVLYVNLCHELAPCFFFVPLPLDPSRSLKEPLEKLERYSASLGEPLRVKSATLAQKEKIEADCPGRFTFASDDGRFDYVYDRDKLATLSGKKLHGKRNHINKFLSQYSYNYIKLEQRHAQECLNLYAEWAQTKPDDLFGLKDEWMSVNEALYNFEALGLVGGAIEVGGRMEAFTIGERLTKDMALIHIEKGNTDFDGIFPLINQQFVLNEFTDMKYINREEDMGLEGLRRAKRSYQPLRMIEKYDLKLIGEERE